MLGVRHPVCAVSDVRRTDARRRERDRPEGITHGFQVSVYKVDPRVCVLARNLLSNDDCRAALLDEVVEVGPQMPLISKPSAFTCLAERLARAAGGPDRSAVGPAGASQGEGPDTDSGEEMALGESVQVDGSYIFNASFVHDARRDVAGVDEVAQPLGGVVIEFVVVGEIFYHRGTSPWK